MPHQQPRIPPSLHHRDRRRIAPLPQIQSQIKHSVFLRWGRFPICPLLFLFPRPDIQRSHIRIDRPLNRIPIERPQLVIHELAQKLLPKPPRPHHRPRLLQEAPRNPRAFRPPHAEPSPVRAPELPRLVKESPPPRGVLISQISPSPTASIGRSAWNIRSSTRAASSITSIDTAENPRTVSSVPGSPTMREPFGSSTEIRVMPIPARNNPQPRHQLLPPLSRNSADCRSVGLATRTRLLGRV